ncbi:Stk1 family PASTA domain-containing Ser/Thr kinase [Blastococcus sp. CT_GayMR16]|uniref:Stk1 family PASTA domain-containing Ser/Thr kinase n=1 Tax=Blastococcus sp. CT_GayMR16 TaxID=2559607 RepID=UPI0010735815|nr:Stk1 family PASTA domain-containing Ser/Thr kinase [Blastococcus sp. CT_GayMR16]TFV85712.1 Stk1 family PASTA domain-containing Ser/Thr kinase [Blastococcus sp. CT_GayMR16]
MTTPQVLGERYEIGGVLGRGGMAEVHRGRDLRLGREVAVKVLRSDLARDPSFQVRFRREAQAAASLNHPAIVAVYDTGEDRTPIGATPYIVMEYVEGETLRDVIRREGHLSPERAMELAADICGALDFSHRNGIVHRDVKPGNVMITPQGTVKVMDFGIARAVSDSAATMTSTAAVIGTAQYLSPEQARGESVDARSDVYSMGCLLYELVTGAPPFSGDSPVAVAYQHVREDPRLPSSINPQVPAELDAILLKAMSKNPANRYQSAAEMRNDLLRALAGQRVEATPVMGDAEKTTILSATPGGYGGGYSDEDRWDDEDEQARRRKRKIIAIVAVLAVLLLGGAIAAAIALSGDDAPPATSQVQVPPLVNVERTAAEKAITDAGLTVGTVDVAASATVPEGSVVSSDPSSGASVDKGSAVNLVVSGGPNTVEVPSVIGLTEDRARDTLDRAGFTSVNSRQVDSIEDEGTVVAVDPGEGEQAALGSPITLQVSTGTIKVPDVTGKSEAEARSILTTAGFADGQITSENVESDAVPQGAVVGTDPRAGSAVGAGEDITLQIAAPAETITVPATTGQSEAAARTTLQNAGFTNISRVDTEGTPGQTAGTVVGTDPPAGSKAAPGDEIVLLVVGG